MQKASLYIFSRVENALSVLAQNLNLTYNQINIIVYYMLIPFSWLVMLDMINNSYYFTLGFLLVILGFFVGCRNFRDYSDWLFTKSVFLDSFNKYGSNYTLSSVVICVFIPIIIYSVLIYLNF